MSDAPDEELIPPSPSETQQTGFIDRLNAMSTSRGPFLVAIAATAASLALVCLFAYLLIRSDDGDQPTPTPEEVSETPVGIDTDTFSYLSVSNSSPLSVTMETPVFLQVKGEQYSVQAEVIPETGSWAPAVPNTTTSLWVYGSIINYVFGLEDDQENRTLLESLNTGDEIFMTTRSGMKYTFAVNSLQQVDSNNREIFSQRAPGITLVLLDQDLEDQRIVAQGRYVPVDAQEGAQAGRVVELGETAQLENLQITVTGTSLQSNRPEAPPGFSFFMIDYQAQNVGSQPVNAESLEMVLADDLGNLYALNPTASRLGNNPPLSGSIMPGQAMLATAGYQIPATLSSATLRWQVSIVPSGSQIQVNIPFQDEQATEQQLSIQLQEVIVSPDGGSLIISGQITNLGSQPLVVDVSSVSLSNSAGTIFLMLSTNPAFPWSVPPGQTLLFVVTFQRPLTGDAIFTILNQSFQLTGLR